MASFRDFAKKAFSKVTSFVKKATTRNHQAPIGKVKPQHEITHRQSVLIDQGMQKIQAFIMRGIILNPVPKRQPRDRSGVRLCINHQPKTRRVHRKLWYGGTYERKLHGELR